jgi:signal recognition particle subunit SRP54
MVLAELGGQIKKALYKLTTSTLIDDSVIKDMLKEISEALLNADVNVTSIKALKDNITKSLDFEKLPGGLDKRKYIKKVVFEELTKLISPGTEAPKLTKGKPNVIMFVGLQGAGKTTTCKFY